MRQNVVRLVQFSPALGGAVFFWLKVFLGGYLTYVLEAKDKEEAAREKEQEQDPFIDLRRLRSIEG